MYQPGAVPSHPPDPDPPPPPTDDERTEAWVLARFVELGFTVAEAEAFVHARADWHEAQRMLLRGCPSVTAMLILL